MIAAALSEAKCTLRRHKGHNLRLVHNNAVINSSSPRLANSMLVPCWLLVMQPSTFLAIKMPVKGLAWQVRLAKQVAASVFR
jgi:hypothetical protein